MKINILVKESQKDKFDVKKKTDEKQISLVSFWDAESIKNPTLQNDIQWWLKKAKLTPGDNIIDFCNLGLAVYNADTLVSREAYGYYNWSRYFKIFLPVIKYTEWNSQTEKIQNILSFLTGDRWEIVFRERKRSSNNNLELRNDVANVCLLSGGLDSFIGAIDQMSAGENISFVSHHKMGIMGEKSVQCNLINSLKELFGKREVMHFPFYVQSIPDNSIGSIEATQRARSILFIALGLLIANSYNPDSKLIIPENGFISLNVPMTKTRLGTFSTKTTHPKYIHHLNLILDEIGVSNKLFNPYSFSTKGEMIQNCSNPKFLKENLSKTISCSKGGVYMQRFHGNNKHCGHCTPCIIRQAAVYKAEYQKYDCGYHYDDIVNNPPAPVDKSGRDIQAFKIGIQRTKESRENIFFDLLLSGELPGTDKDLKKYQSVFLRGLKEVDNFLNGK